MRAAILIAILSAATAASALAGDDIMAPRFGNTIVVTAPDGSKSRIYYNADNTFKATNGFITIGGTWSLNGTTLCRKYSFTIPGRPNPECDPVTPHKLGDTWKDNGSSFSLVKGVQ